MRLSIKSICLLTLFLGVLSFSASAQVLGTYGTTYQIAEKDMEEYLKEKAAKVDIEALKRKSEKNINDTLRKGPGLNLPIATKNRTFYVDPSIELAEDIRDDKGKVLIPKGTKANPADHVKMTKTYLFIDGRNEKQIEYAAKMITKKYGYVVVILTDGDILNLFKKFEYKLVYFAKPHLIERFSIQRTPSILTQEGKFLRVEEKAL